MKANGLELHSVILDKLATDDIFIWEMIDPTYESSISQEYNLVASYETNLAYFH